MIEQIKSAYDDYRSALAILRKLEHPNFAVTIILDDADDGWIDTLVPRAALISLFLDLAIQYRNELSAAYRAEANALEGEQL
jgi:hypothetical protein